MSENMNKLLNVTFYNKKNSNFEDTINFESNFDLFKQKLSQMFDISIEEINNDFNIFECMNHSYNLINNNEDYLNLLKISQFILNIVVKPKNNNNDDDIKNENNNGNNNETFFKIVDKLNNETNINEISNNDDYEKEKIYEDND